MVRRNNTPIAGMTAALRNGVSGAAVALLQGPGGVMERGTERSEVSMRSAFTFPLVVVAAGIGVCVMVACSSSEERGCRVNADCTSGVCASDGRCVAPPVPDAGAPDTSTPAPGDDDDDVIIRTPDDGGGLAKRGCIANRDGKIEASEVPTRAGLHGIFRFATKALASTQGTDVPGSKKRRWDFGGELNGDTNVLIETLALPKKWYAPKFPNGSYATAIGRSPDLLAVFAKADNDDLTILGAVSSYDGPFRTELINSKAVAVLSFPLEVGKKWESGVVNVTGVGPNPFMPTSPSVPYAYKDEYKNEVDAEGEVVSPLGTFDVLRVKIVLTRTFPAVPPAVPNETVHVTRQYAFVTECYGNVASISSELNEPNEEFTNVAEIRRIAP